MTPTATGRQNGALSAEELQLADRAARRLRGELQNFIQGFPATAQTASGLARHLNVDRTTCQRAVFAATRHASGPVLIGHLPGIRGLRRLVAAARSLSEDSPSEECLGALEVAIERFDALIQKLAGSQSRLVKRIDATPLTTMEGPGGQAPSIEVSYAEQLFEAATEITGRCSESWVAIYLYRPIPGATDRFGLIRCYGLIGHRARADSVPLTIHNFSTLAEDEASTPEQGSESPHFMNLSKTAAAGRTPDAVLADFSSDPIPLVSSKQPDEFLVQSIDIDGDQPSAEIDLMLGNSVVEASPRTLTPPILEAWALINFPVRNLLFDVYMHRDFARACIPDLDAHLWRPDFGSHVGDRWQTQFAESPKLQLLGRGIRQASSPAYARHVELTEYLFENSEERPDDYVGFRCEVPYPTWRVGYRMSFDFSEPDAD